MVYINNTITKFAEKELEGACRYTMDLSMVLVTGQLVLGGRAV